MILEQLVGLKWQWKDCSKEKKGWGSQLLRKIQRLTPTHKVFARYRSNWIHGTVPFNLDSQSWILKKNKIRSKIVWPMIYEYEHSKGIQEVDPNHPNISKPSTSRLLKVFCSNRLRFARAKGRKRLVTCCACKAAASAPRMPVVPCGTVSKWYTYLMRISMINIYHIIFNISLYIYMYATLLYIYISHYIQYITLFIYIYVCHIIYIYHIIFYMSH